MGTLHLKIFLSFFIISCLQSQGQTVYNYSSREYYDYNQAKQIMVLNSKDNVGSSLGVDDKKRTIVFKIDGIKEFALYDNLLIKGLMTATDGRSYLHYIYVGPKNDVLHFYISKEWAKIESFGSMLRLGE